MIGSVVDKTTPISSWNRLMTNALITIEKSGLKAFPLVTKAESMRSGVQTAMMTAGIYLFIFILICCYNSFWEIYNMVLFLKLKKKKKKNIKDWVH